MKNQIIIKLMCSTYSSRGFIKYLSDHINHSCQTFVIRFPKVVSTLCRKSSFIIHPGAKYKFLQQLGQVLNYRYIAMTTINTGHGAANREKLLGQQRGKKIKGNIFENVKLDQSKEYCSNAG